MPHTDKRALLITMPQSHYAEKARWALDRLSIPYVEAPHIPLVHRLATARFGGRSVPVLVHGDNRLVDSTDILRYVDTCRGGDRLYPMAPDLRLAVETLEHRFDEALGPHTRRCAYFQLLPHRASLYLLMSHGVPRMESILLTLNLPMVIGAIRKGLGITQASAQRSFDRVCAIFAEVDELLSNGRPYLVGDHFTAADLTFAALASPVLLPKFRIAAYPKIQDVPHTMRERIEQLRDTDAGRFALRMYAQERMPLHR